MLQPGLLLRSHALSRALSSVLTLMELNVTNTDQQETQEVKETQNSCIFNHKVKEEPAADWSQQRLVPAADWSQQQQTGSQQQSKLKISQQGAAEELCCSLSITGDKQGRRSRCSRAHLTNMTGGSTHGRHQWSLLKYT